MSWLGSKKSNQKIAWESITETTQIESALSPENDLPVLFFKHSARCSISSMVLNRFEKEWRGLDNCRLLFLDLLKYRDLSHLISEKTGVVHESPQAILVKRGKVIYHASHNGISSHEIEETLKDL